MYFKTLSLIVTVTVFGLIKSNAFPQHSEITPKVELEAVQEFSNVVQIIPENTNRNPRIFFKQGNTCNIAYAFSQSGITGMLSSLAYPGNYPAGSICNYDITSPLGTTMLIACNDFLVPCGTDALYVALSGDKTFQVNSNGYCGQGALRATTIGNSLYMSLRSSTTSTATRRYQCQITVQGTAIGK